MRIQPHRTPATSCHAARRATGRLTGLPLLAVVLGLSLAMAGCDGAMTGPQSAASANGPEGVQPLGAQAHAGPFELGAEVYDIAAAPDGSILFAENTPVTPATNPATYSTTVVREIRRSVVRDVLEIDADGPPLNGVEAVGRGNFFVTSGALDQAEGAGLWHVSRGRARLVGDIEAFERNYDPDASEGPQWKNTLCEEVPPFTAGPQSNPYHVARLPDDAALVADAAGNSLLEVGIDGEMDWVAVFTPPVDENGDWRVLFPLDDDTDCYVQPVPTSVAVGPDGAYYVGELTGVPAVPGWSRVWRIEPGARNVVCPSDACEEVFSGLTSVIDVAFGPDGNLYVVEYDESGWLAVFGGGASGGTVNRCELDSGMCFPVETGLTLPGAITFDKWGSLWVLENGTANPTVRRIDLAS